ncbi:MAG: hypothetical protein H6617_11965 [Bdellovibrionaceae bacterium]|nr:hypothetical protein [Pseudobdellovibrionaceae bacterium]
MLSNLSRPNFFPGQLIDYKDFNRLAEQADKSLSLLCRYLYTGGGIVMGALEEFAVVPMGGLTVRLKPGMGILPNGQILVLTEERVLDLSAYVGGKNSKTVVVSVKNQTRGMDRYADDEDATITGFKTEVWEPEVLVSTRKLSEPSLEIFRVSLSPEATTLRMAEAHEEWSAKLLSGGKEALLDGRFRTLILPHTLSQLDVEQKIAVRRALYSLEDTGRKLAKLFLVEDPHDSAHYLSQLHAEVLSVPYQPLKVSFIASEYAKRLSLYLEHLLNRLGRQQSNLDRTSVLQTIEVLEKLRRREVIPRPTDLGLLTEASSILEAVLKHAEKRYNLLNAIEEGLIDMRTRLVPLESRISLGGHVLNRVDWITLENKDKYQIKADGVHSRAVTTKFKSGDTLSIKGAFIKSGVISVEVNVPNPDRPLILVLHQYVRRAGAQVHYEINGKHLVSESGTELSVPNSWANYGLVVPAEHLVAHENRLKIRVEKADLDFGFFDLAVYQPQTAKEADVVPRTEE